MPVTVASLHIYPLKSGRAHSVTEMRLTSRGPENDRLWMVVRDGGDKDGVATTQRDAGCSQLATVETVLGASTATFTAPAQTPLTVVSAELTPRAAPVTVWGNPCASDDAGDTAAAWFSEFLERPCRLVRMSDRAKRTARPEFSRSGDEVSFADGSPLLVASLSSLDALRPYFVTDAEIGMERFRPNIVLAGLPPFAEDVIEYLKIGSETIELVKPCERCVMTTIDQQTGEPKPKEPLATLAKLRRGKGGGIQGVFFAQDAFPRSFGNIAVGDPVEILSYRAPHPALAEAKLQYASN